MATKIRNVSGAAVPLFKPYNRLLPPGASIVIRVSVEDVLRHLGGARAIKGVISLSEVSDSDPDARDVGAQFEAFPVGTLVAGADEPDKEVAGLAPVFLFKRTTQTVNAGIIMPDDWNRELMVKLALVFVLSDPQMPGDILDFRLSYTTPTIGDHSVGPLRTATNLTGSFEVVAGRDQVGATYIIWYELPADDADNPFDTKDTYGFDIEAGLVNILGVKEVHLKVVAMLYNIRS